MARGIGIHVSLGVLAAFVCGTVQAQAGHYELVNLGTLGGVSSEGFDINIDGEIAGQSRLATGTNNHGFFWSESTGLIDVGTLGGTGSEAWGINDHGHVVGRATVSSGTWNAFLWINGTITNVYPASYRTDAIAINNDDIIVGGAETVPEGVGFVRLSNGTITLGDRWSWYTDINDPAPGSNALATGFWTHTITDIDSPIVYDTVLNTKFISPGVGFSRGINRDGTLAGNRGSLPIYAKASDGYAVHIAPRVDGYTSGRFYKINSAGLMVGYNFSTSLQTIGVIYMEGAEPMNVNTLLDATTSSIWRVSQIRGVNDRGYFTGTGVVGGATRAVLLRPLDADGDGLDYYEEVYVHTTNPELADTDSDGLNDGEEIEIGTDPKLADTDGDGTNDGQEIAMGTNPTDPASNPGNEVVFPDANLEAAVRSAIGLPAGPITIAHLVGTGFTELTAHVSGISDLTGLEYCKDLVSVYLGGNQITDITPLGALHSLEVVHLHDNQIESLAPVAGLQNMTHLLVGMNNITDLSPIEDKTSLVLLSLGGNNISDLSPLSGLTAVYQLSLDGNAISNIAPLSSLISLEFLDISNNLISDLSPIAALPNLRTLYARLNLITDITPVSSMHELQSLNLSNNQIASFEPLSVITQLRQLYVEGTRLQSLTPLVALENLSTLWISYNTIPDITPLSNFPNLRSLYAENCRITDISPLAGTTQLSTIQLSTNSIEDISVLATLESLGYIDLSKNRVRNLAPLQGLPNIFYLRLGENPLRDIAPLATNPDIGAGVNVRLESTPLTQESLCTHLPILIGRGALVVVTGACGSDTDGDDLSDNYEALIGTNPNSVDSDGDALQDNEEIEIDTDPTNVDSDYDGIPDGAEVAGGSDPLDSLSVLPDVYVDGSTGNDITGFGSQSLPWATIAQAVSAVRGTTSNIVKIHVARGAYTKLHMSGGGLLLDSNEHLIGGYNSDSWSRDVAANPTIIDASLAASGAPAHVAVSFVGTRNTLLDGFTVTGANSTGTSYIGGAGIRCSSSNSTTAIQNCLITGNYSNLSGSGGISVISSNIRITDCIVAGNFTAGEAGGIEIGSSSRPLIERCLIAANSSEVGGAITVRGSSSSPQFVNCVISGNSAGDSNGGALLITGGTVTIVNSTVANNDAASGGGIARTAGTVYCINSIFSGNRNYAISDLGTGTGFYLENCLFDGNPEGDIYRYNAGAPTIYTGAAAINANVAGATGNVDGDPLFSETAGVWTAVTQDSTAGTLTLTDATASFDPNVLRHGLVALSDDGTLQAPILANTSTSIVISDDYLADTAVGDAYRIADYHLEPGSAAIDMGLNTSAPEDGGVTTDFDGVARGFDGDGEGAVTADGSDYDIGAYESDFPIVPTLTVTSPNGGELIPRGSVYNITWSSTGLLGPNVKVIVRKGLSSGVLSNSTPNDGSFAWSVPANTPTDANFLIEVVSTTNPAILDRSDAFFTITPGVPTGTLAVTAPNGGESYLQGATVPVAWTSTGTPGANVDILARRGAASVVLASATPNDGAFNWIVPTDQAPGTDYVIEVRSSTTPAITDSSNAPFSISAPPTLLLSAPNGGESYFPGATLPIAWSSTGNPGANVDIVALSAGTSHAVATSTANDGAFDWVIPANQALGTDYTIQVRSTSNPAIGDTSNAPFTIQASAPANSLTLLSPNGGEAFLRGTTMPITWTSTGNVGSAIKVVLRRGTYSGILFGGTPNDGVHQWSIPANYPAGTGYTLEISSTTNPAISDVVNAPFTITDTPPAGAITVTAPNGGESYLQGGTLPITWTSTGAVGATVQILAHGAGQTFTVDAAATNDGAFDWAIPSGQPTGANYIIEVRSAATPAITDSSNSPFAINAAPPAAAITVTAPNGGESYFHGGIVPITWTSTGAVGATVQILAHGAGQTFTVDAAATNDGALDWSIPAGQPTGTNYTIEVRSVTTPAITDSSNASFTINAAPPADSLTLVAPNGGETFTRGSTVEFRWNSTGNVGTAIKIVLRRGTYVGTLFGGTPNDGVHYWTIPANYPTGSGFTIEISSVANPAIGDVSNGSFSIAAP